MTWVLPTVRPALPNQDHITSFVYLSFDPTYVAYCVPDTSNIAVTEADIATHHGACVVGGKGLN